MSIHAALQNTFQRLAVRYDWQLAPDLEAFLGEAAAVYDTLDQAQALGRRVEFAVRGAYSARLYQGIVDRQERATTEIWRSIYYFGLRKNWSSEEAFEIAQETVRQIIEQIDDGKLRSPHSLLGWQFWIYRAVCKDFIVKPTDPFPADDDTIIAPGNLAGDAELQIVGGQLRELLERLVSEPGLTILIRSYFLNEKPRHIADALGLPDAQVRLHKCRALNRLRNSAEMQQMLRELVA